MDLTGLLRDRWGLLDVEVEPHDGGLNSRTWWVAIDGERRYVATWVADDAVASLAAGVEAAAIAATSGVETGAAEPAVGGDRVVLTDGGSLVLLRLVTGDELEGESVEEATAIGATLARVHTATAGHDLALGLRWPWVEPDGAALAAHPDLQVAVAEALDAVAALPSLVTGIAHGDPAPEAFLRLADGSVALIDWAGALVAPLLYDVASAAMYLGGLGDDGAQAVLAAYADAGGPATPDLPHVATMLRFRWAVQADYYARRVADRPDDAGNLKGLADAREHLLD